VREALLAGAPLAGLTGDPRSVSICHEVAQLVQEGVVDAAWLETARGWSTFGGGA
jgi:hypothetical protein